MVLQPIFDPERPSAAAVVSAWSAVEQQQTALASAWWLITQPDHAAVSGEIASHFSSAGFPQAGPQIVTAIGMHDAGWNLFESDPRKPAPLHANGRPVSFFEIAPQDFLRAWTASIDRAQEDSAAGAYMVSQHFSWLGDFRLQRTEDPPAAQAQVRDFLAEEQRRRDELKRGASDTAGWDELLPLLQFCDLLSLYLCSGSRQPVEFPQQFAAGRVRARYAHGVCALTPSPFPGSWTAGVTAHRHPRSLDNPVTTIAFSLK